MPLLVLVIEDDQPSLELMSYLLEAAGHRVVGARDGDDGFRLAVLHRPDVIVCDLQLPGSDGFTLLSSVRSTDAIRRRPVIAVTAYAMVGDRTRVLRAGFDGYITKPIDPEAFSRQIGDYSTSNANSSDGVDSHR